MLASPLNSGRQGFPVAKISGFTLVELLTVIAIIMILAGIVVGVQRGVYSSQANAKAKGEIQAIATALEQYKAAYGTYPRDISNNAANLFTHLTGRSYTKWDAAGSRWINEAIPAERARPVIDASNMTTNSRTAPTQFNDPWGRPYVYIYTPTTAATDGFGEHFFILYSLGPDGLTNAATSNIPASHASAQTYFGNANSKDDIVYGLEYSGIE